MPASRFNFHVPQTFQKQTQKTIRSVEITQIFAAAASMRDCAKIVSQRDLQCQLTYYKTPLLKSTVMITIARETLLYLKKSEMKQ